MDFEKTIDVLNNLVEINNDRIEGYDKATNETEEQDLKSMFMQFALTSENCRAELSSEIIRLGSIPTEGTKVSGNFFRVWMDVKAALVGHNRKIILDSCDFGEDNAVSTYEDVLNNDLEYLTPEQVTMISAQFELIKANHQEIKTMRDAAAKM
ncbi:MAG: PA2169 family four-helix-bundle protein [Paludibacter sp.]|nr:PA2169 family four-helix-bundle protein [Paludibacter sp.]